MRRKCISVDARNGNSLSWNSVIDKPKSFFTVLILSNSTVAFLCTSRTCHFAQIENI